VAPIHPLLRRSAALAFTRKWWSILAMGAQTAAVDCILGQGQQVWVPQAPPPLALDAIRLLFRVDAALYPQEERALASAQTFRADFAAALALPAGAVELREARGGGVLLLDVTPSPNSSSSAELVRIRQLVLRGARRSARPSMAIIELHRLVPWHPGLVSVASADEIMGARNALLHVLLRIVVAMVGVAAFMGGGYWWYSIHELGVGVRTYASVDGDEISTALTAEGEARSTERA